MASIHAREGIREGVVDIREAVGEDRRRRRRARRVSHGRSRRFYGGCRRVDVLVVIKMHDCLSVLRDRLLEMARARRLPKAPPRGHHWGSVTVKVKHCDLPF